MLKIKQKLIIQMQKAINNFRIKFEQVNLGINYIFFESSMVLLDIENLNILVLFLLAFISYKGYQANRNSIECDSDDENLEINHQKKNHLQPQVSVQLVKEDSQIPQNVQNSLETQLEYQGPNQEEPKKIDGQYVKVDENEKISPQIDLVIKERTVIVEQARIQGQRLQKQNSNFDDLEEKQNSEIEEQEGEQEQVSENIQVDGDDEKEQQSTKLPMGKLKKIYKMRKKVRKELENEQALMTPVQSGQKYSIC